MGLLADGERDRLEAWWRGALRHEPAPDNRYPFPMTVAALLEEDGRAFDHHVGWAAHPYPVPVAHLRGDEEPPARLRPRLEESLGSFAATFDARLPALPGPLAGPPDRGAVGRRAGQVVGWTPLRPGRTRRIPSAGLRCLLDRGALIDDLISRGWHGPHGATLQSYSGPASPYRASKGFVGPLLPATAPL
ncbi:MAG TPA: DUF2264 domain-containing protein [Pseudonocardia sp.]|uniref:DUF2264 domain-containing protein n=1 Tax=Pseudonocardia sp. TaxID=60912 RepID=UPI002B4B327A|nr:DUF2264 domain-containing protein [Pseudonocardia sp.]HLU55502.1 DUF2264 domain-containing protein [Pseudonocardia sp.]